MAGCLGDGGGTPTSDGTDTPTDGTDTPTDEGTGAPGKGTDRSDGGTDEQTPTATPEPVTSWHRDHDWEIDETAATNWDNYEVTRIFDQPEFMDIELAPDGRLFYITRGHGPGTGGSTEETFRVGHVDPDTGADGILLEKGTFTATPGSSATDTPSRRATVAPAASAVTFERPYGSSVRSGCASVTGSSSGTTSPSAKKKP